jgi:putative membrane protein
MHDGFGWWAVVGTAWMVLFWGAIVWLIARAFAHSAPSAEPGALDLARRRYAAGEISREQYLRLVDDLAGGNSAGMAGSG